MGHSKAAGKLAVLLAVAALFAAATADHHEPDDRHWKCYSSCMHKCYHDDAAVDSADGGGAVSVRDDDHGDYHKCKKECVEDCFEDVPAVCYHMCVADSCLSQPPYNRVACFKRCGIKCFHHDGPKPGPKPNPGPPKPGPKPMPPKPTPPKPGPKPGPPKPGPKPGPPNRGPKPCPCRPNPGSKPMPPPKPAPKPLPRPPCPPKDPAVKSPSN